MERMQTGHDRPVFLPEVYDEVITLYRRYKERSGSKVADLVESFEEKLSPYFEKLAQRSLEASGALRCLGGLLKDGLTLLPAGL